MSGEARLKKIKENQEKRVKPKKEDFVRYEIINNSNTELVLYYGFNRGPSLIRYKYISIGQSISIKCMKSLHTLAVIPFFEICNGSPNSPPRLDIPLNTALPYNAMFFKRLHDYDGEIILINERYIRPKTEIEKWKECALKSKYLLDQLIKLGGMDNDNFEPILDMVQDIQIPKHDELDKERSGIPSSLTNIT